MARTLLVVDDVSINREILRNILKREYDVIEAADGDEALAAMRAHHKTLSAVLLDLTMPVMNGFEVLSHIREDADLRLIPVIVTTGATEEGSEVRALSLGANDYVTKPYNATIILQRIRNTINLRETAAAVNALRRDKLTGLYNREAFFERVEEMIAEHPPGNYTMSSLDIGSFKVINDQYGTEMGDEVLRHVARCIDRWASPVGGVCCRVMADSFALLFPTSLLASLNAVEATHAEIAAPACIGRALRIRIGRCVAEDLTLSASALYDRATIAELSVKDKYDAYIAYYVESMRMRILREQEIVNEMHGALRDGQFEVWFQPQFNHASGALVGAEALVRWRHPGKGLVSPGDFIPVFERNGFIYELDKYVWARACAFLRAALDAGETPLPVSVNISRHDLFREDIVETLSQTVERYALPVELLRCEITESAFAANTERVISVVDALIAKGFTIEIDDFGSGYSSLNTLKDVPASILKLDMRFLEGGRNNSRGGNIIESVVRMAKWLNMPVIAEGVETVEQANFLKSIGCYYIQGYLYARPMPQDEYERYIKGYSAEREMLRLETMVNLDNNAFWDPNSMETLIFNSYVGGACIFEYANGRTELLRVNDNYAREIGLPEGGVSLAQRLDLAEHMDAENLCILDENIRRAIETGAEACCEVRLTGLREGGEDAYIRAAVRLIAKAGSRCLLYASVLNMTALRQSQRKEREASEQMTTMMNDTPGGFARIRIFEDGSAKMVYVNEGFCRMVGASKDKIMAMYGVGSSGEYRLEELPVAREAYREMASGSDWLQLRHKLQLGDRGLSVTVYGHVSRTESGDVFLNTYLSDESRSYGYQRRARQNTKGDDT